MVYRHTIDATSHVFENLRDLLARAKSQQLRADFEAYLDGFSANVQEILEKHGYVEFVQPAQ